MHITVDLIALAVGYKIYADACKEKEGLRLLGRAIGIVVMIAGLLCAAYGVSKCAMKQRCSTMKQDCPMMSKANSAVLDKSSGSLPNQ